LQLKIKTRVVIGAILLNWIALPAFTITYASISTDIIYGTCVPWFGYSSYAAEKTLSSLNILITYLFPLMCVAVCYSRIVYTLRTKVTSMTMSCCSVCFMCFYSPARRPVMFFFILRRLNLDFVD